MPPSDLLKEPVMRRGNSTPSAQHALISHSSGALSETPPHTHAVPVLRRFLRGLSTRRGTRTLPPRIPKVETHVGSPGRTGLCARAWACLVGTGRVIWCSVTGLGWVGARNGALACTYGCLARCCMGAWDTYTKGHSNTNNNNHHYYYH